MVQQLINNGAVERASQFGLEGEPRSGRGPLEPEMPEPLSDGENDSGSHFADGLSSVLQVTAPYLNKIYLTLSKMKNTHAPSDLRSID